MQTLQIIKVKREDPDFHLFAHFKGEGDNFSQVKSAEDILFELSPQQDFFKHGEGQAFICRRGEIVLGRIYASVDRLLPKSPRVGVFGYFNCINDHEVAYLLLKNAEEWLRDLDCEEIHGPMDLNIYNGHRAQTKGFEKTPFPGEPRSPQHLHCLIEKNGFAKAMTWDSWDFPRKYLWLYWLTVEFQILKMRLLKKQKIFRARGFNQNNLEEEFEKIYPLIMDSFKKNYLFTHVDLIEYKGYFLNIAKLLDPASSMILNEKNEAIAFFFLFENIFNHNPKEKTLVLHTACIAEKYRKGGLMYLLSQYANTHVSKKYSQFIGALAKNGRTTYDKLGESTRSYATYKKMISR